MTHRTVPLDLLVRVRDVLSELYSLVHEMGWTAPDNRYRTVTNAATVLAELTAQIEQQREGQGEPVAWMHYNSEGYVLGPHNYPADPPHTCIPLYAHHPPATPQDSVPAWAWRQAIEALLNKDELLSHEVAAYALDHIESRARELTASGQPPLGAAR